MKQEEIAKGIIEIVTKILSEYGNGAPAGINNDTILPASSGGLLDSADMVALVTSLESWVNDVSEEPILLTAPTSGAASPYKTVASLAAHLKQRIDGAGL